jgi:predicted ester cyclase
MSPAATKKASAKQVATAYFEAIAARDVDAMMELWEPGGYGYLYGMAALRAPEGYREWFGNMLFRAFPDFEMKVLDMVAYGEKAAVRWGATGTFAGPARFEGLEPNGARVEIEGLDLLTIRDGVIRENRAYTDSTEMARQLGAMPPAGSPGEKAMIGAVNLKTRAQALLKRA